MIDTANKSTTFSTLPSVLIIFSVGSLLLLLSILKPGASSPNLHWLDAVYELIAGIGASIVGSSVMLYFVDMAVLRQIRDELTRGIYYSMYGLSVDDHLRKSIDAVIYRSSGAFVTFGARD